MANSEGKIKKILSSKWTMFFLLLGFIWLALKVADVYYKKYKINKEIQNLKNQIGSANKTNQEISNMIDYLSSQSFLEKEAREKLNMKKEGEEVVILEPANENPATTSEPSNAASDSEAKQNLAKAGTKTEPNFLKWWRFFFK